MHLSVVRRLYIKLKYIIGINKLASILLDNVRFSLGTHRSRADMNSRAALLGTEVCV